MPTHPSKNRTSNRPQARKDKVTDNGSTASSKEGIDASALLALRWRGARGVVVFAVSAVAASGAGARVPADVLAAGRGAGGGGAAGWALGPVDLAERAEAGPDLLVHAGLVGVGIGAVLGKSLLWRVLRLLWWRVGCCVVGRPAHVLQC